MRPMTPARPKKTYGMESRCNGAVGLNSRGTYYCRMALSARHKWWMASDRMRWLAETDPNLLVAVLLQLKGRSSREGHTVANTSFSYFMRRFCCDVVPACLAQTNVKNAWKMGKGPGALIDGA